MLLTLAEQRKMEEGSPRKEKPVHLRILGTSLPMLASFHGCSLTRKISELTSLAHSYLIV
jgi:hypothetical protein